MVKESNYSKALIIESDSFCLDLIRRGIISLKILDYKVYYERFVHELKITGSKEQAYINASEEYNVCDNTIRNAVKYMMAY